MRKNIFDIVSENVDMESEVDRIITISEDQKILLKNSTEYHTLFDYVDRYCFRNWKYRGHFLDVDDFLYTLDYEQIEADAKYDVDSFMTLIEVVYNFWQLSYYDLCNEDCNLKCCRDYYHLKDIMDDILKQYNHIAYIDKENERVLVVEDKQEVTAVAEILPDDLSLEVIRYNHNSLKGDVETKKAILFKFGADLEPKRKMLKDIDKTLEDQIFYMLNKLNIRHNNIQKGNKNYVEYVANMDSGTLESWYDELYQMILLAYLMLDNVDRKSKIKELRDAIENGK